MKRPPFSVVALFAALSALFVPAWGFAFLSACTHEQGAAGAKVATTIADATCREIATGADAPEWITLACAAEGVASGVVNVRMRRVEWAARRGACARGALDAGPGL